MKFRISNLVAPAFALFLGISSAQAQSNLVVNPSFETNTFSTFPGYCFQAGNGPITGWTHVGHVGLNPAAGVNPFANNGLTPNGSKVAFLQNAGATLSQNIRGLSVGQRYELRYFFNGRSGFVNPTIRVSLGGTTIHSSVVVPVNTATNYHVNTFTFTADATNKVLRFEQIAEGDATLLVDQITLRPVPAPDFPFMTSDEIVQVTATTNEIILKVKTAAGQKIQIAELNAFETKTNAIHSSVLIEQIVPFDSQVRLPRFVSSDRIYSGFIAVRTNFAGTTTFPGEIKFAEETSVISKYNEAFPVVGSKKGLQVQMTDDAIEIGTKHAAINLNLSQLVDLNRTPGNPTWVVDGETFYFDENYLFSLDLTRLSDAGMVVSFILIYLPNINPALDSLMVHPKFNSAGTLSAFNSSNSDGIRYLKACMEFLADRYSRPDQLYGRVANFIVGNEINAHWYWYNMGLVSMETVAEDYLRTVRICHTAVRKSASQSRVYLSLDHSWAVNHLGDSQKGFPARTFIDYFAARAKAGGDFDWHIAHHPYPQSLFESRTWLDTTATTNVMTSPRITFKNIELLPQYLSRTELLYRGAQRRIILSEQGFHSDYNDASERRQAAAYCYAYHKTKHLPGIDSFILHRHVDHSEEGGLNLGLWRRITNSVATPDTPKPIYQVYKQADTTNWQSAFQFALAEIGITNWDQLVTWNAPAILAHPTNTTAVVDGAVSLTVSATGSPAPFFQWRFNGVDLTNQFGTSGVTNATLTLSNLVFSQAGNYSVFVRNGHGSVTSANAALTVLTIFEGWRRQNFSPSELQDSAISAANADPDGDTLANALEYALSLNPRIVSDLSFRQPTITNDAGQLYIAISYRERLGTSGVTFTNQISSDLLKWSGQGVLTRMLSQDSATRTMEARAPLNSGSNLFLRCLMNLQE